MDNKKIIGYCGSCGAAIREGVLTNYGKTLYVCDKCHYPNTKEYLEYSNKKITDKQKV